MLFENLKVKRLIVHEIFQRNDDRSIRAPVFSNSMESLSSEAMGAFRLRMTDALSAQSQSLEMRITKHGLESFLTIAEALIEASDLQFLEGSKKISIKLAEEQRDRRIPGGMLIIFDGTVGATSVPYLGVIIAETQAGFRRSRNGEQTVVGFLQNIFLTPATRLYKIGLMLFDDRARPAPSGRRAWVFDSNISASDREAAAAYFYEGFLGCSLPSDGPYETARFFDLTKEFVRKSNLEPDKKRDLIDSLYVFVRDEQDPTFTADQFGSRYLPADMQDGYASFLEARRFTPNAVVRDTTQMGNRLRRRRLKFGSDIELSASPEALKSKVTIEAIEPVAADVSVDGQLWTRIVIQEALTGEQ